MKKYFLTGLVTLLPLALTIWVVHFLVDFLTKPFIGSVSLITNQLPIDSPQLTKKIAQILVLIFLFILTFVIGFVGRRFFFNQLIRINDNILAKIPLVNKVYKTAKEIVQSLLGSKEKSFKQVVLLQFPYQGAFCIGLIAKNSPKTCSSSEKKDLIFMDMSAEQAIKYVVSCAVIQPEEPEK